MTFKTTLKFAIFCLLCAAPLAAQDTPAFEIDEDGVVRIKKLVVEEIETDKLTLTDQRSNWEFEVDQYENNHAPIRIKHVKSQEFYLIWDDGPSILYNGVTWLNNRSVPFSDARLKHNVALLDDRLFSALRPVTYNLTDPSLEPDGDQRQIGFIADEVERIYPELVFKDADGFRRMRYGQLTAILTAELQRTQAELAQERTRLRALEDRLSAIEARMPTLATAQN